MSRININGQFISLVLDNKSSQVLIKFDQSMDSRRLRSELLEVFRTLAKRAEKFVKQYVRDTSGLVRRSGELLRAITANARFVSQVPQFRVGIFRGPALKYAAHQEWGTDDLNPNSPYPPIVPKRRRTLAWPVPGGPATTPGGTPRYRGPRHYEINTGDMLGFIPWKGETAVGGLYNLKDIQQARRKGWSLRNIQVVYVLLKRTSLPPHWYLRDSMKQFLPQVSDAILAWVRKRWSIQ